VKFHDGDTATDLATRAAVCLATTSGMDNSTVSNLEDSNLSFFDSGVEDPSTYVTMPAGASYTFMDINKFVDLLGLYDYVGTQYADQEYMKTLCVAAMPVPQEWSHIENMKVNITSGVAINYFN
jgi:hypothetical protein